VVHMPFGVELAAGWHFHHVHALPRLQAVEVQIAAAAAHPFPRSELEVARVAHADAAEDGNALFLHEALVRALGSLVDAISRAVFAGRVTSFYLSCHHNTSPLTVCGW